MKEKGFKKGITKRLFSVVLALAMVFSLMPTSSMVAYAVESLVTLDKDKLSDGPITATVAFTIADEMAVVSVDQTVIIKAESGYKLTKIEFTSGELYGFRFTTEYIRATPGNVTLTSGKVTVENIESDTLTISATDYRFFSIGSITVCYEGDAPQHRHDWKYTVGTGKVANRVTATCAGDGDCTVTNGKTNGVSLTLTASGANYSGSAVTPDVTYGTSEQQSAWKVAGIELPGSTGDGAPTVAAVYYQKNTDGTKGSSVSEENLKDAGDYLVELTISYGEGAGKSAVVTVPFTINKAAGTDAVTTDTTIAAGYKQLTVNGAKEDQEYLFSTTELTEADLSTADWTDAVSPAAGSTTVTKTGLADETKYYVYTRVKADENHLPGDAASVDTCTTFAAFTGETLILAVDEDENPVLSVKVEKDTFFPMDMSEKGDDEEGYVMTYRQLDESKLDFDLYVWEHEGKNLRQWAQDETEEEITYEVINGVAVASYLGQDTAEGVTYDTLTVLFDLNGQYAELVFYYADEEEKEQAEEIVNSLIAAESAKAKPVTTITTEKNDKITLSVAGLDYYQGYDPEQTDEQIGYYYSFASDLDFDVYAWDEPDTELKEAVDEELANYAGVTAENTRLGGYPAMYYDAEDTVGEETYKTRTYIVKVDDTFFEVVFYADCNDADELAEVEAVLAGLKISKNVLPQILGTTAAIVAPVAAVGAVAYCFLPVWVAEGRVVDANDEGVPNACVKLERTTSEGTETVHVHADEKGYFESKGLRYGHYTVTVKGKVDGEQYTTVMEYTPGLTRRLGKIVLAAAAQ